MPETAPPPEAPNSTAPPVATPTPPPPTPPPAAPPPPAPAVPPTAPANPAPDATLDPGTPLVFRNTRTDAEESVTLAELIENYSAEHKPQLDEKALKEFELFQKVAHGNDPEAMHEMIQMLAPTQTKPPPAPGSVEAELQQIREEFQTDRTRRDEESADMKKMMGFYGQIEQVSAQNTMKGFIAQHKENLPFLSRLDPSEAARIATGTLHQLSANREFVTENEKLGAVGAALRQTEDHLKHLMGKLGGQASPAQPNANGTALAAVNDQTPNATPGHIPAGYTVFNGVMMDSYGRPIQQTAHGTMELIPQALVTPAPTGQAVPPAGPAPSVMVTPAQFKEQMRARNMREQT